MLADADVVELDFPDLHVVDGDGAASSAAACLLAVAHFFDFDVPDMTAIERLLHNECHCDGASANDCRCDPVPSLKAVAAAADDFGLRASAVSLSLDELEEKIAGGIPVLADVGADYVVVIGISVAGLLVIDPTHGTGVIPLAEWPGQGVVVDLPTAPRRTKSFSWEHSSPHAALARHYAESWNLQHALGQRVPTNELQSASEELHGTNWCVHCDADGKWSARHASELYGEPKAPWLTKTYTASRAKAWDSSGAENGDKTPASTDADAAKTNPKTGKPRKQSGEFKDKLGRRYCLDEGRRVKCAPKEQESKDTKAGGADTGGAGESPASESEEQKGTPTTSKPPRGSKAPKPVKPARPSVDDMADALHQARTAGLKPADLENAAKLLSTMTVKDITEIKKRLGLKASGVKAELVRKIMHQIGAISPASSEPAEGSQQQQQGKQTEQQREPMELSSGEAEALRTEPPLHAQEKAESIDAKRTDAPTLSPKEMTQKVSDILDGAAKDAFDPLSRMAVRQALEPGATLRQQLSALSGVDTSFFDDLEMRGLTRGLNINHNEYFRVAAKVLQDYENASAQGLGLYARADYLDKLEIERKRMTDYLIPALRKLHQQGVQGRDVTGDSIDLNKVADFYEKYGLAVIDSLGNLKLPEGGQSSEHSERNEEESLSSHRPQAAQESPTAVSSIARKLKLKPDAVRAAAKQSLVRERENRGLDRSSSLNATPGGEEAQPAARDEKKSSSAADSGKSSEKSQDALKTLQTLRKQDEDRPFKSGLDEEGDANLDVDSDLQEKFERAVDGLNLSQLKALAKDMGSKRKITTKEGAKAELWGKITEWTQARISIMDAGYRTNLSNPYEMDKGTSKPKKPKKPSKVTESPAVRAQAAPLNSHLSGVLDSLRSLQKDDESSGATEASSEAHRHFERAIQGLSAQQLSQLVEHMGISRKPKSKRDAAEELWLKVTEGSRAKASIAY